MSRQYHDNDLSMLYGFSAGRCNKCRNPVYVTSENGESFINIGERAHNLPFSPNGPRGNEIIEYAKTIDKHIPDNSYKNLILLCKNDHKIIDTDSYYSVEVVKKLKKDHEIWVRDTLLNKDNENDDFFLLNKIHRDISFQTILNALEWQPSYILFNVSGLSTFEEILTANKPTHYPFKAEVFNNLTNLILENWISLRFYLRDQDVFTLLESNDEFKLKYVSNRDYRSIRLNCIYIRAALNLWIEKVKLEYPNIILR